MWDFHSHIVPAIDDGAKDIEETLQMARIAVQEGIQNMIATPHYIPFAQEIHQEQLKEHLKKINDLLKEESIPLTLLPGMEVFADWEIIKRIEKGDIATINDTRYLLMELPMHDIPDYIEDLLFEIEVRKLMPIIAHPERNAKIQKNPNILAGWIEKGALAQLNTGSLMGILGQAAQETAEILLKQNMIHILGTDAHTAGRRSPRMKEAVEVIKQLTNPRQAHLILEEHPRKILANQIITPALPVLIKKKKKFFFF